MGKLYVLGLVERNKNQTPTGRHLVVLGSNGLPFVTSDKHTATVFCADMRRMFPHETYTVMIAELSS